MNAAQRELDLVLYGATGFVGKLTAQYLAGTGNGARIALAGRSPERLAIVRDSLGPSAKDWPLIAADATAPSTLDTMAARTRVVVTTVGPYSRYGLPLVAACAAAGTDYADLTGEATFVRECIDLYHKQAADNGARIVHSCGFDSIPSDVGVYALYRRVQADGAGELGETTFVLRGISGGFSGGTIASGMEVMRAASSDPQVRRALNDPYTLSTDRVAEPDVGAQPDFAWRRGEKVAPELAGRWVGGFLMGPYNTRVVRRSNALQDWAYGRTFRYSEVMSLGSSQLAPWASATVTAAAAGLAAVGNRYFRLVPRRLVERVAPKPGSGPRETARERGYYRVETYTTTTTGARYVATIAQRGDPGYKATSVLLGESGLGLALDRDRLSPLVGDLTPAAAMGDVLLSR
ncbi:MAG TPA: saccharopine dehydrogenase NADP-binding domain-containing protein, partial [Mycobacterium sp.]|nr:saccharopine dehydrogenase NADP-binding domain-containing protein [Mycobacterium sp.]